MPLSNKVWFITGASSGFGHAFADYALGRGHRVLAAARDTERLQDLAAKAPDRAVILALDVTLPGDAEAAVAAALSHFGRIDVLINAAGYDASVTPQEASDADLRAQMETNFFGVLAVTRAALPAFRAQQYGAIVNLSGMGGRVPPSASSAYAAGKFALEGASEALAQEMAPFGTKVLIVEPGWFRADPAIDPAKAAAAIETALDADVTPLRLALGGDAVDAMRSHCHALLADLAKWEPISRAMGF